VDCPALGAIAARRAIVSADQLSEFVSVGGAAEKAQERDVVHVGEPLRVEAEALAAA